MSKKGKAKNQTGINFDEKVLSAEQAQEMHSTMARIVRDKLNRIEKEMEKGMEVDMDELKFCQTWMRDNKVVPLSKEEQAELLKEDDLKAKNKELIKIRNRMRGRVSHHFTKESRGTAKVSETVRDNRLNELHEQMQEAEQDADGQALKDAKALRKQIKLSAREQDISLSEYIQTLPPEPKLQALEALELIEDSKQE